MQIEISQSDRRIDVIINKFKCKALLLKCIAYRLLLIDVLHIGEVESSLS